MGRITVTEMESAIKNPSKAVERPCRDCVWHSEDGCFIWDCDPITRQELADARRNVKETDKAVAKYIEGGNDGT